MLFKIKKKRKKKEEFAADKDLPGCEQEAWRCWFKCAVVVAAYHMSDLYY